jgi:hypothetical protein
LKKAVVLSEILNRRFWWIEKLIFWTKYYPAWVHIFYVALNRPVILIFTCNRVTILFWSIFTIA